MSAPDPLQERVARVLADRGPHRWDWLNDEAKDRYRADAATVLADLREAGELLREIVTTVFENDGYAWPLEVEARAFIEANGAQQPPT